jgi:hypothetical protein
MIYHVRAACGVTIDWTQDLAKARKIARAEGLQLWALNPYTGQTRRI